MNQPQLLKPHELTADRRDWTGRWRGDDIWRVLNAARDGDTRLLKALLEREPTLAQAEYWYTPPLHFAVREGHLDAVRLLVDAGADLFHRTIYGQETTLQVALDRQHNAVADYLRAALRDRAASDGAKHAIHEAVAAGDAQTVDELLHRDPALANRGDALGRRPLHYAVQADDAALVDLLLRHGAEIDATGFSSDDRVGGSGFRPITSALWHHPYWRQRTDTAIARHLLARGAACSITVAAALGDEERVRELLKQDPTLANDQELCGKRPISAAAERNHGTLVEALLDAGADPNLPEGPNCPRGYALWAASHFGFTEIAERLLAAGADPNADVESSGTPTGSAKDAEMRALLLRHGGPNTAFATLLRRQHRSGGGVAGRQTGAIRRTVPNGRLHPRRRRWPRKHAALDARARLARATGGDVLPDVFMANLAARPIAAGTRHGPEPAELATRDTAAPHGQRRPNRRGEAVFGVRRRPQCGGRGVPLYAVGLGRAGRAVGLRALCVGCRVFGERGGGARMGRGVGLGTAARAWGG